MKINFINASAEGFVHMSSLIYDELFLDEDKINIISAQVDKLSNEVKHNYTNQDHSSLILSLNIDCKFNNTCAHGHKKCCIRLHVTTITNNLDARKVAIYAVQKSTSFIYDFIINYDMEVQIHRIRLLKAKGDNGYIWIRPDNFDPKKGPRIHGC